MHRSTAKATHCLEYTGPAFRVPSLNLAVELLACVEYAVVVILIVYGASKTVSEHALRQRRQRFDRVLLQKGGRCGGIPFGCWIVAWCAELVKLVLR
jgi:hypothetical protein